MFAPDFMSATPSSRSPTPSFRSEIASVSCSKSLTISSVSGRSTFIEKGMAVMSIPSISKSLTVAVSVMSASLPGITVCAITMFLPALATVAPADSTSLHFSLSSVMDICSR